MDKYQGKSLLKWKYGAYNWFKIDIFGHSYVRIMRSYNDKNIEPIFSDKLKNMEKCLNLEKLRTAEPQKNLPVLIRKKVCILLKTKYR